MADEPNGGTASSESAPGTETKVEAPAATETKVEAPATETKTEAPATLVVPEKYELKLADGMDTQVPSDLIEKTAALARTLGLSNEKAQELLNDRASDIAAQEAARLEANKPGGPEYTKRITAWEQAALADPDIGGTLDKLKINVEHAKKVLGTFGDETIATFLNETGFGSNPSVIKMMAKIGKAMSEGTFVQGTPPSKDQITDPAERLYGGSGTKTTTKE